ncbi:hypothetical protein BJ508DRAFT_418465 [Ascobolus immersus RN42]|uniref:Uncharacterized protein n=1 Tax=Ascobolus immersus RN42 TaxID=1160509 RepID=A0A3N4HQH2_ASCIM|nr:hypothetical protein BJ508DRAFT_418465 [Ascobolus immersus RN42]
MAERQRGSTSALQPGEDYGNSDGASGGSTGGGTDYDGKSETFKDSQGELGRGSASGGHTGGQNSGGVGAQLAVDDSGMFFAPGVGGMVYAVDFDSLRAIEEFRRWGDISTAEDNLIASRSVESWEEVDLGDETTHPIQQSGATPLEMYFSSIDFEAGYYDEYISVDDWEQIEEDWVEVRKEMVEKYEETTTSGNSDSLSRPTTPSPMPKGYDPMDWSPSFTYLST